MLHVLWTVTKNRFNRTCEVKSVLCPHPSTAKSSNNKSCRVVVEKSRTISEVAKSYGLVPQTVGNWVNKWRKTHSGIEGEEMTAAQLAEYKKIKAELREARMEIDFLKKAAAFLRGGSPSEEHDTRTSLRQGRQPPRNLRDVPLSGWCRIQGCYTLAQQGHVRHPAKRRRGTRQFL